MLASFLLSNIPACLAPMPLRGLSRVQTLAYAAVECRERWISRRTRYDDDELAMKRRMHVTGASIFFADSAAAVEITICPLQHAAARLFSPAIIDGFRRQHIIRPCQSKILGASKVARFFGQFLRVAACRHGFLAYKIQAILFIFDARWFFALPAAAHADCCFA